jgi:hypothetical protein
VLTVIEPPNYSRGHERRNPTDIFPQGQLFFMELKITKPPKEIEEEHARNFHSNRKP